MLVFVGWGVVSLVRALWAVCVSDVSIPFGMRVVWAVGVGVWCLVIGLAVSSDAHADGIVVVVTQYQDEAWPGPGYGAFPDHACKFFYATAPTCEAISTATSGVDECSGYASNVLSCSLADSGGDPVTDIPTDGTPVWLQADNGWTRAQAYSVGAATEGGGPGPDVTDIAQYWAWGLGLVVAFFVFGRVCGMFLDGIKHG